MVKIKYQISIPEKGINLLGNIYSPKREDLQPFIVKDINENKEPLFWDFKTYWHEFVRKTTDDSEIRKMLVQDYWFEWRKRDKYRKKGIYYVKKLPFFKSATNAKKISRELFDSDDTVNDLLRTHLLGPVGVVVKTFKHEIPTGKKIDYDDEPTLGHEKGTVRYLADGTAIDCRRIFVHSYHHIYVPYWIRDQVQDCIDSEQDERGNRTLHLEIDTESLGVVSYIIEKTSELRERFPSVRNHYFNETAISNETGFNKSLVKRAVRDTVGVLSEAIIEKNSQRYHRKVFLPGCREELAKDLTQTDDKIGTEMTDDEFYSFVFGFRD